MTISRFHSLILFSTCSSVAAWLFYAAGFIVEALK